MATAKKSAGAAVNPEYAKRLALYEKLVATLPGVERKGAANPYTSLNGNMFSILTPAGVMAFRLGKEDREEFLAKYAAKLHESYGVVQKEYVAVPETLLGNAAALKKTIVKSYAYAQTLKPKATTRPAK
jgi:hypothetical protein